MEVLWDCFQVTSSRPYGTFRLEFLSRTASWAKFSRPCGTGSHARTKPHSHFTLYGPAKVGYSRVGSGYKRRVQQGLFVVPDRVSFKVGDEPPASSRMHCAAAVSHSMVGPLRG